VKRESCPLELIGKRGGGDGKGRSGAGLGSGDGGSNSIGKAAGVCLLIVFAFSLDGCDSKCHEFFSAKDRDFGFFADYVVC
jgi:hypothetical protein